MLEGPGKPAKSFPTKENWAERAGDFGKVPGASSPAPAWPGVGTGKVATQQLSVWSLVSRCFLG